MKIAYITSLYPAVSQTFIFNEIKALRNLGVKIETFSIRQAENKELIDENAIVEFKNTRSLLPLNYLCFFRALVWCVTRRFSKLVSLCCKYVFSQNGFFAKIRWFAYLLEGILFAYWLKKESFNHIHCHFGNSGSNTALLASKLADITLSITFHGSELNEPKKFLLEEKVQESIFIVCISKFGRSILMQYCKRDNWPKINIIRCGLTKNELKQYPKLKDKQPSEILCVGRLSIEKGHFILFDAIELIQNKGINIKLTLIGDGPLLADLEKRKESLPNPEHVQFTGALPPEKVMEYYEKCSLVVLASFSEGVPVVLMEAFSKGRPVVSTYVGGIPELVTDSVNGFLVSPGDSESLADAIEKILANPVIAEKMGKSGAAKVFEEFNEDLSAKRLKRIFEENINNFK